MIQPDDDQQSVVDADMSAQILVVAPPGAGKTWTAAQRLCRLARAVEDNEAPLLALSFSRAAGLALSKELRHMGVVARVEVRTIDSWTTRVLAAMPMPRVDGGEQIEVSSLDYDGRILRALELQASGTFSMPAYSHIVVDEAQDIRGPRALLVESMLQSSVTCGWTVLGDPAQAIFDFADLESKHLFELVEPVQGVTKVELKGSHRATSADLLRIRARGAVLREREPNATDLESLWAEFASLRSMTVEDVLRAAPQYADGPSTTAILVRDNASLFALSMQLNGLGVDHDVASGPSEKLVPRWVAEVFGSGGRVAEDELRSRLGAGVDADGVLSAVKTATRAGARLVDLGTLADQFLIGRGPELLMRPPLEPLTLSTVHRAKGLEFDKVIVSMQRKSDLKPAQLIEETKVLYVSMTRSKQRLFRMLQLDTQGYSKVDRRTGRLVEYKFAGRGHPVLTRFELRPDDIDYFRPWDSVGSRLKQLADIRPGEFVRLDLVNDAGTGPGFYEVRAETSGVLLGATRPSFCEHLAVLRRDGVRAFKGAQVAGQGALVLPSRTLPDGRRMVVAPVIRGMIEILEGR